MDRKDIQTESGGLRFVVKKVGDQVVVVAAKEHLLRAAVEGKYHDGLCTSVAGSAQV